MRYLFVTTYPPTHCGIGAYAYQEVLALQEQGHIVNVTSVDGAGDCDFIWNVKGGLRLLKLVALAPFYERIVIQYHPAFFYRSDHSKDKLFVTLAFLLLFLATKRKTEILCHEFPKARPPYQGSIVRRCKWKLFQLTWKLCPKVVFHTNLERNDFAALFGLSPLSERLEVRTHGAKFRRFCRMSQSEARRSLGLPQDRIVFLSIGFIQRHKGFDRVVRAIRSASAPQVNYYIVGSLRTEEFENLEYLAELSELVAQSPGTHVVEGFVTDEEFDKWIIASDWVVLPYREIWSSGVLARAQLYDRPAIISAVGGLPDQAGQNSLLFSNDSELIAALLQAASLSGTSIFGSTI
jgi:glycosyltransferase involved in cell wall biosynthesis